MHSTERTVKSKAELRRYGLIMAGALGAFALLAWWRQHGALPWLAGASLLFATFALVAPAALRPVEAIWMRVGEVLGNAMSMVLLTLLFFLLITPIGLLVRLFSGDTLGRKPDPSLATYWIPRGDTVSRPDRPF